MIFAFLCGNSTEFDRNISFGTSAKCKVAHAQCRSRAVEPRNNPNTRKGKIRSQLCRRIPRGLRLKLRMRPRSNSHFSAKTPAPVVVRVFRVFRGFRTLAGSAIASAAVVAFSLCSDSVVSVGSCSKPGSVGSLYWASATFTVCESQFVACALQASLTFLC